MVTRKDLSLIYEIQDFADSYLGKVTKFHDNGSFRFQSQKTQGFCVADFATLSDEGRVRKFFHCLYG